MRKLAGLLLLALLATYQAPVQAQSEVRATAEIKDASGATVGRVTLIQEQSQVHIVGDFSSLPPGLHGFHIHTVGACAPDFNAAGAHFNPENRPHGPENPAGPHAGDLANLTISADGRGTYDHKTSRVTLLSGPTSLFDQDGSAFIVHADADDYKTDPTGNSGGRIACGVIQLAQAPSPTAPVASPTAPVASPTTIPLPETGLEGRPAALPNTGDSGSLPWSLLLLVVVLLGGGLLIRRVRA